MQKMNSDKRVSKDHTHTHTQSLAMVYKKKKKSETLFTAGISKIHFLIRQKKNAHF